MYASAREAEHTVERLHPGIQRWLWKKGWSDLRDIQRQAIAPVFSGDCDLVISASTASGKTEAAFLPACSVIAKEDLDGIGIVYISPLKSLINDQYRRLRDLCQYLDFPVTPWHGDISSSLKNHCRKNPKGILLTTPESLEAMLINHSPWLKKALGQVAYFIIDEFHAFIGNERGCQLQSLLHRLEFLLQGRLIPRIALSATLGDMTQVMRYLRPNAALPCHLVESTTTQQKLKLQLRAYVNAKPNKASSASMPTVVEDITNDLYRLLRGQSNLIFTNSRQVTEGFAAALTDCCAAAGVPNEFFPHHGSLAKEVREQLEQRLQQGHLPTSAVCTMTLELGIDIGDVHSVAQLSAPWSVASLRQRLGRSGRRGDPAILRLFIVENELHRGSSLHDLLRLELLQSIAIVSLLLEKCYEPANADEYHFSTLIQQTLSLIAQYGSARAKQIWVLLCKQGPFRLVTQQHYAALVGKLVEKDFLIETHDGQLVLGSRGEHLTSDYNFYAAFKVIEEYRLEHSGKTLGTLPIDDSYIPGVQIIFAGGRWQIQQVDDANKVISLIPASGGKPPSFSGNVIFMHNMVRQRMYKIYEQGQYPSYLDGCGRALFNEGLKNFQFFALDRRFCVPMGKKLYVVPWLGGRVINTLIVLWQLHGLDASGFASVIEIDDCNEDKLRYICDCLLAELPPSEESLSEYVCRSGEKYDHLLPMHLSRLGYGTKSFDVQGAWEWMSRLKTEEV